MFGLIKKNKTPVLTGKEWIIDDPTILFWLTGIIREFVPKEQVGSFSLCFCKSVDVPIDPGRFLLFLRQEFQAHSGSISQGSITGEAIECLRSVLVRIEGLCLGR